MYKTKMSTPLRCLDAPAHYKQGEIECIDAMESALVAFGKEWLATYCTINAIALYVEVPRPRGRLRDQPEERFLVYSQGATVEAHVPTAHSTRETRATSGSTIKVSNSTLMMRASGSVVAATLLHFHQQPSHCHHHRRRCHWQRRCYLIQRC